MPAQYEEIKKSYLKKGKSLKEAEKLAAMTYNSHRPEGTKPVTRGSDSKERRKKLHKMLKG